jgi:hypothetical protein
MKHGKRKSIVPFTLCALFLTLFVIYRNKQFKYSKESYALDSYTIIHDTHQTKLIIGVASSIDKEGLQRTLTKAADENQSFSKRDYMISSYLWVEAHLVDGNLQSKVPAGKLRRYVPPVNGERRKDLFDLFISIILPRNDSFTITLQEARLTMSDTKISY